MDERLPTVDFVVESPDRKVQLSVEAKGVTAPSSAWAAQYLRNLAAHAVIPRSEYFLLVTRNRFFLWRNPDPSALADPDFEGDTAPALAPYLWSGRIELAKISGIGFETLVQAWLTDLVRRSVSSNHQPDWVEKSGLGNAIRHGTLTSHLAA